MSFEKYVDGKDTASVIKDFGVAVHESCHKVNDLIGEAFDENNYAYQGYLIEPGIEIKVKRGEVYNSYELNMWLADSVKNKIYRYQEYIGKKQDGLSSQSSGIYGLMNEMSAYKNELSSKLELHSYYMLTAKGYNDPDVWQNYFLEIAKTHFAYYEFKLFILWYLQYAKEKNPKVFESCMNNTNLRVAYTLLESGFEKAIAECEQKLDEAIKSLNANGHTVYLQEVDGKTYFYIRNNNQISGIEIGNYQLRKLRQILEKQDIAVFERFRMRDVTKQNYKNYLVTYPK